MSDMIDDGLNGDPATPVADNHNVIGADICASFTYASYQNAISVIRSITLENDGLLAMPDPARELARILGLERLAAASRSRLDDAIQRARMHLSQRADARTP